MKYGYLVERTDLDGRKAASEVWDGSLDGGQNRRLAMAAANATYRNRPGVLSVEVFDRTGESVYRLFS